jgi:mRNA-degrading endonuclease toxin of MazEF toxin-antitoxin module
MTSAAAEPRPGEVWWCDGRALGFRDGGKTRPVLVVSHEPKGCDALVAPLTSRKPDGGGVLVAHRAGRSWLTGETRSVRGVDLVSSLGAWPGFAAWNQRGR